jgi:hypothetical protein
LGTGQRKIEKIPVIISCFIEKVKTVACGTEHTLFLTNSKKVYACGENSHGQLGIGNKKNSFLPVKIMLLENITIQKICAKDFSAALTEFGELYQWGNPKKGQLFPELVKISNSKIENIDIGLNFGVCVDFDGNVYSWGNNTNGELGMGDFESKDTLNPIPNLKGRKIKGIYCGGSYVMVLGNVTSFDENKGVNPPINEDIERIKESVFLKNKHNGIISHTDNGYISKRNKQYMKSTENFLVGNLNINNCNNDVTNKNEKNCLNDMTNCEGKLLRVGKNLTPIRHLTSEEIKSRQQKSFHNQTKNNEMPDVMKGVENEIPDENYMINNKDAEKLKNLLRNNEGKANEVNKNFSQISLKPFKIEIKSQACGGENAFCKSPHQNIGVNETSFNLSSSKLFPQKSFNFFF